MKIDLHVHSNNRSPCGKSSEEEQIQAAIQAGLDGLGFTDHHRLVPPERLCELNQRYSPFRILAGVEITVAEMEDILVYGIQDAALESTAWLYADLHRFVRAQRGMMILAHPYRYHADIRIPVAEYPPDAIEVHSINTPVASEASIRLITATHQIALVSNSDAHLAANLGGYYNHLPAWPASEMELWDMIKTGSHSLVSKNGHQMHY